MKELPGKMLRPSILSKLGGNNAVSLFDQRQCALGEGVFWHPVRKQLFWFDIEEKRLLTLTNKKQLEWQFNEHVSAAGWIDKNRLLIASETRLFSFNIETSNSVHICDLEESINKNRSNDGRADPWGGFWISTMGKVAEHNAGSIYRYYQGQLRQLFQGLTIPNSICFSSDSACAYFSDTYQQKLYKQNLLDNNGWPSGEVKIFANLSGENLYPDGAVVDAEGNIWCACWGSSQLICLTSDGKITKRIKLPASQPSCPAFGDYNYKTLYVTSARQGLKYASTYDGQTFKIRLNLVGVPEPQIII